MSGRAAIFDQLYKHNLLVAIALVGVLVFASAVNVYSVSPSNVATYNKWTTVDECSYLIFTDGTTTYAKNCETGAVSYSGTSSAVIIQQAIDALGSVNGGTVYIAAGTYTISDNIIINGHSVNLVGAGRQATLLNINTVGKTIEINGKNRVTLRDFTVGFTTTNLGTAITILGTSFYPTLDRVNIAGVGTTSGTVNDGNTGLYISGAVLGGRYYMVDVRDIQTGVKVEVTASSAPNANSFFGLTVRGTGTAIKTIGNAGHELSSFGIHGLLIENWGTRALDLDTEMLLIEDFHVENAYTPLNPAIHTTSRVEKLMMYEGIVTLGGQPTFDSTSVKPSMLRLEGWNNAVFAKSSSGTFAVDSTGSKTVTIAHGVSMITINGVTVSPTINDVRVAVAKNTNVSDWEVDAPIVQSIDSTNVVVRVNVRVASGTVGATGLITLQVGEDTR